ncbi:MAG: chemotaxis protein CheX [Myxococcales bacterium]|nr:chemotaxis protein CheX [Myxococcales bacterium]
MISAEDWLAATTKSLIEVAETYFDVGTMTSEDFADDGSAKCGAIIGLISENNTVQLMMLSSRRGSESLGKALLGFEADEAIETGDLADAIGEIINIVAGMVKGVVNDQDDSLNLTLPTFVEGTLEPVGAEEVLCKVINMGPVQTKVLVFNGSPQAARKPRSSAA